LRKARMTGSGTVILREHLALLRLREPHGHADLAGRENGQERVRRQTPEGSPPAEQLGARLCTPRAPVNVPSITK